MRRLKGGKPRRFRDHRRREARPYIAAWEAIAERYPPVDRLGRRMTGMAADFTVDYDELSAQRQTPKTRSARRKTAGILLGLLRFLGAGAKGTPQHEDIAALLADMREEDRT